MTRRAWILVVAGLATLTIGLVGLGSDGLAELNLRKIVLEPPSAVTRGEVVTVRAWVMNTGERPAGEFKAEFFYRRQSEAESWISFYTVIIANLPPSQQDPLEIRDDGHAIGLDTSSLELGTYEIRVVADSNNLIPEWDKTNNELVTTLTVLASRKGLPDLQPTSLSFNPPSPTSGELVVVSSEIRNTGDRDAGGFRVAFFVDDREFDGTALEGLAVGGSVTAQGALDPYALALGPGSHTLRVGVDSLGKVEEQDEANNQLAAYLTIEGADLFPVSLEFGRSLVRADEQVAVSSRVRNLGRGEAKGVEVAFLIDGVQFGLANLGTLGPGAEAVASGELLPGRADLALAPGVHEVRIVVDPHGLVSETDKANNVAVKSLTLLPGERKLAELHPESLELNLPSPVELGKANAVTVSSVIKNTGKALAKGFAVEFGYRMKGTLRWETMPCRDPVGCDRLDLAPGAEMKVEGTFLISSVVPGIYEVRVAVDPHEGCNQVACGDTGRVEEIDETNDELVTTLTLLSARLPDLAFDPALPLSVAPANSVKRGQTLRLGANLVNLGDVDSGPFDVEFSYGYVPQQTPQPGAVSQGVSGQPSGFTRFATVSVRGLAVGKDASVQALLETIDLRPGSYLVRVEIDPVTSDRPAGRVRERVETNNLVDTPILIQGPDLMPLGLDLVPPSPVAQGDKVTLKASLVNLGVEPAGNFVVDFSWCGVVDPTGLAPELRCHSVGSVSFPGMSVNNPELVEWILDTSVLSPGEYLVRVAVDPSDEVQEQNELNNELLVPLVILGGAAESAADLVPSSLSLDSASTGRVRVSARITNQGQEPAGAFVVQFFYEDKSRPAALPQWVLFDVRLAAGLGADETTRLQATLSNPPCGPFQITVVVDAAGEVGESDEGNNAISKTVVLPGCGDD